MYNIPNYSHRPQQFSEDAILCQKQSNFQSILVFSSAQYGNVLVLDGVIQLTERDEFSYHETMVHVPLCSHKCPRHVLIVGGGDGGILREVCRHSCVETITVVEIDPMVVQVCLEYFGQSTATSWKDPRVRLVHADAAKYVQECSEQFDIILGDTSDPVGPAETLFQPSFYESMYAALKPHGIVCVQAECFWIHLDLIADLVACCHDIFETAEYATTMVPTYPCGQIGFLLARKTDRWTSARPVRILTDSEDLQWYSPAQHEASFVLPPFVRSRLDVGEEDEDCLLARCTIS